MRWVMATSLWLVMPVWAQDLPRIEYDLHYRSSWIPALEGGAPVGTHTGVGMAAYRLLYAVEAETFRPLVTAPDASGRVAISRAFHLEQATFLLGEPIVVGLTIRNFTGRPYREAQGGTSQARGRDDHFRFVLQRADGTFVVDPFAPIVPSWSAAMSAWTLAPGRAMHLWQPLQQWCVIDAPGRYVLHCFYSAPPGDIVGREEAAMAALDEPMRARFVCGDDNRLVDRQTGQPILVFATPTLRPMWHTTSPVLKMIPTALRQHLGHSHVVDFATDYCRIDVMIEAGTEDQRLAMRERWLSRIDFADDRPGPNRRASTAAMLFAQQDDWLDAIEQAALPHADRWPVAIALAVHPSPRAFDLLRRLEPAQFIDSLRWCYAKHPGQVIPLLIDLTGPEHDLSIRRKAAQYLTLFTGVEFDDRLTDSRADELSPRELTAMQQQFRDWWRTAADTLVPLRQ